MLVHVRVGRNAKIATKSFSYLARVGVILSAGPTHTARVVTKAVDKVASGRHLGDVAPSEGAPELQRAARPRHQPNQVGEIFNRLNLHHLEKY